MAIKPVLGKKKWHHTTYDESGSGFCIYCNKAEKLWTPMEECPKHPNLNKYNIYFKTREHVGVILYEITSNGYLPNEDFYLVRGSLVIFEVNEFLRDAIIEIFRDVNYDNWITIEPVKY